MMQYKIAEGATFSRTKEVDEMIQVVSEYNAALKAASISDIMSVYMPGAVLIPENLPAVIGVEHIERVYGELVKLIKFNEGSVINIVDAFSFGDGGFVRSHRTHGAVTEIKTGTDKFPFWRELWVFRRDDSQRFKFAVYAYGNAPDGEFDPAAAVLW